MKNWCNLPAFARVTLLGSREFISRLGKEPMTGPVATEAPLNTSAGPDTAAASSVRLFAQPIQSPLTGGGQARGGQAAASGPGRPDAEQAPPAGGVQVAASRSGRREAEYA
jgi:hypothetical protein